MSNLYVENIKVDNIKPNNSWGADGHPYIASGMVLQVVNVLHDDHINSTNSDWEFVPSLSASITPRFTSSKILIQPIFHVGATTYGGDPQYSVVFTGHRGETSGGTKYAANITDLPVAASQSGRDSVKLASFGVAKQQFGNYDIAVTNWNYLDSPNTTTEITYRFKWGTFMTSDYGRYINRASYDADSAGVSYYTSTLTLMEIAG